MRDLKKNKQKMWYALYKESVPIYELDDSGEPVIDPQTGEKVETGEYISGYENPMEISVNVSAGRGDAEVAAFGVNAVFDRVICITDTSIPFTDTTLLWKETEPVYDNNGTVNPKSADYHVSEPPAISLNSMLVAISRNSKTGGGASG